MAKKTETNVEDVYQKVSQVIKSLGVNCDAQTIIAVTQFKGVANCAERLDQLTELLSSNYSVEYEEKDGLFSIKITEESHGGLINGDMDSIIGDLVESGECDDLTEDDIRIFFDELPHKDDIFGWLYRINGCNSIGFECVTDIFDALIDSDYQEPVDLITEYQKGEILVDQLRPRGVRRITSCLP